MQATIYVNGTRLAPADDLSRVIDDLHGLPTLREHIREPYLHGGWNRLGRRPPEVESYQSVDGHNPKGEAIVRTRLRNLETKVSVDVSSRETTLAIIREMKRVGWDRETAVRMMRRTPATGTTWLLAQGDFEAEFSRCWAKADVPVSELRKRLQSAAQGSRGFVSHPADRAAVLAYIEAHPGLGVRALQRAGAGLTGKLIKGRCDAAVKVLKAEGLISTEPGPRGALLHYVVVSTAGTTSRDSQHNTSVTVTSKKPKKTKKTVTVPRFGPDYRPEDYPQPDWTKNQWHEYLDAAI